MPTLQPKPRIGATSRAEAERSGPAQPGVGKRTLAQSVEPSSTGGRPLPEKFRVRMERAFGVNFAAVRVHEDPEAAELGARAFTHGTDIHVAPGVYDPGSVQGQELLGHELAHVIQQAGGSRCSFARCSRSSVMSGSISCSAARSPARSRRPIA